MDDKEFKSEDKFDYVKETIVDKGELKKRKAKVAILTCLAIVITLAFIFVGLKTIDSYSINNDTEGPGPTGVIGSSIEMIMNSEVDESRLETLKEVWESANRYMVTVTAAGNGTEELGVFVNNEEAGVTSGIITKIDQSIFILTDLQTVEDASEISVTFMNGMSVRADVLKTDHNSGIAILSIPVREVDNSTLDHISEAELETSEEMEIGDSIVIVGNPNDGCQYMKCSVLTSTTGFKIATDGIYRVLSTDSGASDKENGFIMNLDGKVVGIVFPALMQDTEALNAVMILDLVPVISKLSEGKDMPYLGINGQEINDEVLGLAEEEMPYGIYVKDVEIASPAYVAGIVSGDIIVKLQNKPIRTLADYKKVLESKEAGEEMSVTLKRKGREGYYEYSYTVKLVPRI